MKELKFIYETSVKKQVNEAIVSVTEENGEKVEVKRTVKKSKPIKVAILKPERKLFKEAEMFYAKTLSNYLKEGLLPYSLVAKRYANDGGPLTDQERGRLRELRNEARKLEAEFFQADPNPSEETQKRKNEILVHINEINQEVSNIQNAYSDIFDSTAEMKARNDTIEWWVLFLIYIDEKDSGYQPLFNGDTYQERIVNLETYEDKGDPFYLEVIKKLSYLISFWFTARNTVTKIDFDTMEKLYLETVSDYKVEEGEDLKLSEVPPEPLGKVINDAAKFKESLESPQAKIIPSPYEVVNESVREKQPTDVTTTSGPSTGTSTV